MVRELEQPAAEPVTITVELPADPEAAERVAEGALGTVVRLLQTAHRCSSAPQRSRDPSSSRWPTGGRGTPPGAGAVAGGPVPVGRRRCVSVIDAVRRANQPGVPEDSVRLRVACLGAVVVAIAACASLGEIAWTTALGAMVLVAAGTVFSHATRARPPGWVKIMVALGAAAACVWFFHAVSSPTDGITSVSTR